MLCGRCKKQILCKCCGETEYSQHVDDGHDFVPDECHCEKFKPDDCQECAKVKRYVNKDITWHIKTWVEAIQIFILMVCLIGFVGTFVIMWAYPKPLVQLVMALSFCIGLLNFLIMLSSDKDWRDDYEDRSMVFNIREKKLKGVTPNR